MSPARFARALLLAALACLACLACQAPNTTPAAPTAPAAPSIEMRTYAVPPGLAPELRGVVDRLLSFGDNGPPLGRAVLAPGDKLVVSATPAVHAGVEQLLAGLGEAPAAPAVIELTYWLVEGQPAAETRVPAELKVARPALDAIVAADGPRAFQLVETLRLRTLGGEHGEVVGRVVKINQSASVRDDRVLARVEMRHPTGELRTHLALPLDTLLVLGQSGARPGALVGEPEPATDLYYLVRARIAE